LGFELLEDVIDVKFCMQPVKQGTDMAFDIGRCVLELVHTGLAELVPTAAERVNKEPWKEV
jgi:hypothetical protein